MYQDYVVGKSDGISWIVRKYVLYCCLLLRCSSNAGSTVHPCCSTVWTACRRLSAVGKVAVLAGRTSPPQDLIIAFDGIVMLACVVLK